MNQTPPDEIERDLIRHAEADRDDMPPPSEHTTFAIRRMARVLAPILADLKQRTDEAAEFLESIASAAEYQDAPPEPSTDVPHGTDVQDR